MKLGRTCKPSMLNMGLCDMLLSDPTIYCPTLRGVLSYNSLQSGLTEPSKAGARLKQPHVSLLEFGESRHYN